MKRRSFRHRRRLGIEGLEQRRMMAGDIDFSNGVITIEGDDGFDSAEVVFQGDQVRIDLLSQDISGGDFDDHDLTRDIDDVDRIVFHGFAGSDVMSVTQAMLAAGIDLSQITVEFHGGDQSDTFYNDTLAPSIAFGGAHVDYLTGGLGDDELYGEAGDDFLEGRQGNDLLHGGLNNDTYVFSGGNLGVDTVSELLNQGIDKLDLKNFNPAGSTSADTLSVVLTNGAYSGYFPGHLQISILSAESIENVDGSLSLRNTLIGNNQANTLTGGGFDDYIVGQGGNDTLRGQAGNDELYGSTGSDSLYGGAGHDLLMGDEIGGWISVAWDDMVAADGSFSTAAFNDYLFGLNPQDELQLTENAENAALYGARDYLFGEIGNDVLYGGSGDDIMRGDRGDDWMFGGNGFDSLHGDGYSETTADGNDFLYGGSATDYLFGRGGNDELHGGDGRDYLYGHSGNDLLWGSYDGDQDVLNGGADRDIFVRYRHLYQMWTSRGYLWFSTIINEELEQDFTAGEDAVQYQHV